MKNLYLVACLLLVIIFAPSVQAQNSEYLKVRVIPAVYETVVDSVVVVPALNAQLDTSNYFTQTEFVLISEPSTDWQKSSDNTICAVRTEAEYISVERRFYPFKNILEVEKADSVIPAQIQTIERQKLLQPARLEKLPIDSSTDEDDNVIIIKVKDWVYWQNFIQTCDKTAENNSF
jgi:hypothetical protein